MRTNSAIIVVASTLSLLTGSLTAWIIAEDEPADAVSAANRQTKNGAEVKSAEKPGGLDEIRRAAAPLLAQMTSEHGYGLDRDQVVRRIAPPFPEVRATYYKVGHPWQAKAVQKPADAMAFFWEGEKLKQWGMAFGAAYKMTDIIDYALQIKPPEIEGPKEFLERRLKGDWVIRSGVAEEQFLKEFETILQKEFNLPVQLAFAKRVRTVYVASGKYKFTPVIRDDDDEETNEKADAKNERIEIYGSELNDPSRGGGGGGELKEFLAWVGRWIEVSIIDEVSEPPS